jgi:hypothetical protein
VSKQWETMRVGAPPTMPEPDLTGKDGACNTPVLVLH